LVIGGSLYGGVAVRPGFWIAVGALLAGLAVAAGAFGAHRLRTTLRNDSGVSQEDAARRLEIFDTAARYHMYHALAVTLAGLLAMRHSSPCLTASGSSFVAGIVVFCGCLYAMALGGPRKLGAIVPIGGVSFIVGWVCLAVAAWRSRQDL
jgi:uncharacterized membrane protein YgdD (TMEM256/DUF423 family)